MASEIEAVDDALSPIDFERYGITDAPKSSVTKAWGRARTFAGLYVREWIFFTLSLVNIVLAVALTLYQLVHTLVNDPASPDTTFTVLILINAGFCVFFIFHGLLRERAYELYALIAAMLVILVYCIVEYGFLNVKGRNTIKLVRLIAACILVPPNVFLAWWVAKDFGWLEFRIVGASEMLQMMYRQASKFSTLLKFDLQVSVSFVVLALKEGTGMSVVEKITLGIGIPYSLAWDILGWLMMRLESRTGLLFFIIFGLTKPAYFLFKIVSVYKSITGQNQDGSSNTIFYSTLAAGTLALVVWLLLMVEIHFVYKNFGKGLKERAWQPLTWNCRKKPNPHPNTPPDNKPIFAVT